MDTQTILWNAPEEPVRIFGIDVPRWISQDIDPQAVASIIQGGCESGAYMPAVTYHKALATMNEHGDDVLQHIYESLGEIPDPYRNGDEYSWSGLAVFFVSLAVELWASSVSEELAEEIMEAEEEEEDDEAA